MFWKIFRRCLLILTIFLVFLLAAQGVLFLYVLTGSPQLEPADVIVAFEGRNGRARTAYDLVDRAYAPALVISPANDRKLRAYDRSYRPEKRFEKIIEEKARTTFENAFYTGQILKKNDFKKVILVTSWDHMPRSWLLLKMMLFDSDTHIYPHIVETGELNRENWYRYTIGWKMIYNEMLESWGSLLEFAKYHISGELPANMSEKSGLLFELKKILLFDIGSAQAL